MFGSRGLVRRLAAAISRLLETHFLTLFHAASALSAPSGHLPLEGKAIYIKRRGRHLSNFSCKRGFHSQPRDGTPQRLTRKFESRDEQLVSSDSLVSSFRVQARNLLCRPINDECAKAEIRSTKVSFPCQCLCDTDRSARKLPRERFR